MNVQGRLMQARFIEIHRFLQEKKGRILFLQNSILVFFAKQFAASFSLILQYDSSHWNIILLSRSE